MPLHDKAFYASIFFIIGLAAASLGLNPWLTLLGTATTGLFILKFRKLALLIFTLITFTGFFYFHLYTVLHEESIPFNESATLKGVVSREPLQGLKSTQLDIHLLPPYEGEVRLYTDPQVRYAYGDLLEVKGVVEKSPTGRLNISSFPRIKPLDTNQGNIISKTLFNIKNRMTDNIKAVLPPKDSALMSGLLFGERAEFSEDFENAMRKSGTTHIVALSGYNVAIIGVTLSAALAYVMSRRRAFYISVVAIPLFVLMTGAQASVVRAGIMGMLLLIAERKSRLYSFRNAIAITAVGMLLFNPRLLVFDISFQLSFAALLGIVYIFPYFRRWFHLDKEEGILGWRRNLFQTLSAQLAVAPIILSSFGYISPTALFSNVLILEFLPLTMLLGFLTAVSGFFSYTVSLMIGWTASLFLSYEIFIINLFGANWF